MDRVDEVAVFVAILEAGSLVGASRELRRSAPVITRTLSALEERLGARLFARTTRRLALTEAGQRFAPGARALLAAYGELLRDRSRGIHGVLKVTAPAVFGRRHVTPLVASFLDEHPEVSVELLLDDRSVDLVAEGVDVGVRIGRLRNPGLVARKVGEVRPVLVAAPAYLASRAAPLVPSDLAAHALVCAPGPGGRLEWVFREGRRAAAIRLAPRLIANDMDALLAAVRGGSGVGRFLSYQVSDDLASGALVRLLAGWEPAPLPVHLVLPGRRLPPKTRAFVDHAARVLSSLGVLAGA